MVGVGGSNPLAPTINRFLGFTMPTIQLPDGAERQFPDPVTVAQVAESIGPGLAKAAIAGLLSDQIVDTSYLIESDTPLSLITSKDSQGLEVLRHSTAHLLAQAVKILFPTAQVTIGPVIEDGFYYDFYFERAFTPDDLKAIEKQMKALVKQALPVQRKTLSREEAISLFAQMGEEFKVEIIKDLPEGETLSLYQQGDFIDLCRGPHVPNTRFLKTFKLMKCSAAYWRGDSNNASLQRIYGTAWEDKNALNA